MFSDGPPLDPTRPSRSRPFERREALVDYDPFVRLGKAQDGSPTQLGLVVLDRTCVRWRNFLTMCISLGRGRWARINHGREEAKMLDDGSTEPLSTIYPDPDVHILDQKFTKYRLFNAGVEKLASGTRWKKGPVWFGDARCLAWSDIPNDRILRWDETTSAVSVFRHPSGNANDSARDRTGRLVGVRAQRPSRDAHRVRRVDHCHRRPFSRASGSTLRTMSSSPSDGAIWFTDPPAGLGSFTRGRLPSRNWMPTSIEVDLLTRPKRLSRPTTSWGRTDCVFSPDEKRLYVVESRAVPNRKIRVSRQGRWALSPGQPGAD